MTNHEVFWLTLGVIIFLLLHYWGYKTIKKHPFQQHDGDAIVGIIVLDIVIIGFLIFNYLGMFNAWLDKL